MRFYVLNDSTDSTGVKFSGTLIDARSDLSKFSRRENDDLKKQIQLCEFYSGGHLIIIVIDVTFRTRDDCSRTSAMHTCIIKSARRVEIDRLRVIMLIMMKARNKLAEYYH